MSARHVSGIVTAASLIVLCALSGCALQPRPGASANSSAQERGSSVTNAPTAHGAAMPAQFAASTEFARAIGGLLFRHQRAIRLAREFFRTSVATVDSRCVTEQIDGIGTIAVRFITARASADQPSVFAEVRVPDIRTGRAPKAADNAPSRKPRNFEQAKLRAQATALNATHTTHTAATDVPVISWRRDGQDVFFAFVLPAEVLSGAAPFAGGFEVVISGNGAQVLSLRSLAEPSAQKNEVDVAAGATLDVVTQQRATPQPIDVFRALQYQVNVRLHTTANGLDWLIEGDRISLLSSAAITQSVVHP